MDRGAWQATVHGDAKSWKGLSDFDFPLGFPGGSDGKESACNVGDLDQSPGLRRSPGEGDSYPLQYSGLENSMDRGSWQATDYGIFKESDITEQLSVSW